MQCAVCGSWKTLIRLLDGGGTGECASCRATWCQRGSDATRVRTVASPILAIEKLRSAT